MDSYYKWVGTEGREPGRKVAGGGNREVRNLESQGGGNWKKLRKIVQHFVIFFNRNGTKWRKPLGKGAGSTSKRYGVL